MERLVIRHSNANLRRAKILGMFHTPTGMHVPYMIDSHAAERARRWVYLWRGAILEMVE